MASRHRRPKDMGLPPMIFRPSDLLLSFGDDKIIELSQDSAGP